MDGISITKITYLIYVIEGGFFSRFDFKVKLITNHAPAKNYLDFFQSSRFCMLGI